VIRARFEVRGDGRFCDPCAVQRLVFLKLNSEVFWILGVVEGERNFWSALE
jgi:hypothetical protein